MFYFSCDSLIVILYLVCICLDLGAVSNIALQLLDGLASIAVTIGEIIRFCAIAYFVVYS